MEVDVVCIQLAVWQMCGGYLRYCQNRLFNVLAVARPVLLPGLKQSSGVMLLAHMSKGVFI